MSSFRLSKRKSDQRASSRDGDPSLTVARVRDADRPETPATSASDHDLFHAGIRALYGQLCSFESRTGGAVRSLGVTSCYRHEGKSTVAAHLAAVAAESRQVLLIDANIARPLVHRAMQEVIRPGIELQTEPIVAAETVECPPIMSTHVLPARKIGGQPTIEETRDLLHALSAEFDLVTVDLPPLDVAGALEWAPLLDGIVLVVEAECVRWQVAARGIALLEQTGGQVLGTVINKRRDYIPQWLYRRL